MKKIIGWTLLTCLWIFLVWAVPKFVHAAGIGGNGAGWVTRSSCVGYTGAYLSGCTDSTGELWIYTGSGVVSLAQYAFGLQGSGTGTNVLNIYFLGTGTTSTLVVPATGQTYTLGSGATPTNILSDSSSTKIQIWDTQYIASGVVITHEPQVVTSGTYTEAFIQAYQVPGTSGTTSYGNGGMITNGVYTIIATSVSTTGTITTGNPHLASYASGTQTIASATTVSLLFLGNANFTSIDTAGGFSKTTGGYTVATAGFYHFDYCFEASAATTITAAHLYLVSGGTTTASQPEETPLATSTFWGACGHWDGQCTIGQVFTVRANITSTGTVTSRTAGYFGGWMQP